GRTVRLFGATVHRSLWALANTGVGGVAGDPVGTGIHAVRGARNSAQVDSGALGAADHQRRVGAVRSECAVFGTAATTQPTPRKPHAVIWLATREQYNRRMGTQKCRVQFLLYCAKYCQHFYFWGTRTIRLSHFADGFWQPSRAM